MPGASAGMENAPEELDTASNVSPVAVFLTTTAAPGMTPPAESTTEPVSDAVALPCASAGLPIASMARQTAGTNNLPYMEFIHPPTKTCK